MFNDMNRASRISRFGPAICLLLVLLVLAAASAFAHDPGLSAADLTFDGTRIAARLSFARGEIAMILSGLANVDVDRDGQVTQSEFDAVRASLESLAKESFAISADGKDVAPTAITVTLGESDAIHFDMQFAAPEMSKLVLRSLLIGRLARGHRQFLSLRDAVRSEERRVG